jgi:hypothetical protein
MYFLEKEMENVDSMELKNHPEYEIATTSTGYIFRRKGGGSKPSKSVVEKNIATNIFSFVSTK